MAGPNIDELKALDVQTKLTLVHELWDSIVEDARQAAALPVSADERRELDEALREDDENPDAAIPWEDALVRLRNR